MVGFGGILLKEVVNMDFIFEVIERGIHTGDDGVGFTRIGD